MGGLARWQSLLLCAGLLVACAAAVPPRIADPALDVIQVGPHSYYVQGVLARATAANRGYTSNAGFVVTEQGVVVIDALGTPALGQALLATIRQVTDADIRIVVVTHYHADHFYGLQVFKEAGAQIWARREGQQYLASEPAAERLAQRRVELAPWVDEHTRLVAADRWIEFDGQDGLDFELGGLHLRLVDGGHAHAVDDLMLLVAEDQVLYAGDLFFAGRLPFVVDGNSGGWLAALERIVALAPEVVVPGHGPASHAVEQDLHMTGDYLRFLRQQLAAAVAELQDFDSAYASIDFSRFAELPTFAEANRRNAYSVYLELEAEALAR